MAKYYSQESLLQRLSLHLSNPTKNITLMVGSGVALPSVPGVQGIVDLIDEYLESIPIPFRPDNLEYFSEVRASAASPWDAYVKYYEALKGIAGSAVFDAIIQNAVRAGYTTPASGPLADFLTRSPWSRLDHLAPAMENDNLSWRIPAGLESLGRLLTQSPGAFGNRIFTTNFDPLIEISIRRHGGQCTTQSLKTDGSLDAAIDDGSTIKVVHLHGYWRSNSTERRSLLHAPDVLCRPRPNLLGGLADLLRDTLVVVIGYGAWDDVFTGALSKLATARECEILWCFYSDDEAELRRPRKSLLARLDELEGMLFYKGVDANQLFPALLNGLSLDEPTAFGYGVSPPAKRLSLPVGPASPADRSRRPPEVRPIGDVGISRDRYGHKAATLSFLMRNDVTVPEGFCIDLGDNEVGELERQGELQRVWREMTRGIAGSGGPAQLIVRSSASSEDSSMALFPGRFASRRNVSTFTDLIVGVNACATSLVSPAVREYHEMLRLEPGEIRMGVIVQRQVPARLAGVAFTAPPPPYTDWDLLIELAEGEADTLLSGDRTGSLYGYSRAHGQECYQHLAGPHIETSRITGLVDRLSVQCQRIAALLREPQDIEWVWDGTELYVVQARPVESPVAAAGAVTGSRVSSDQRILYSLPMAEVWGMKAAAAEYFGRSGWGASNAIVVPPHTDYSEVSSILAARKDSTMGTVVRFSFEAHVGVAKRFVPPGADVVEAFFETRRNDAWVGIVSDYVYVESSFEAYVSDNTLLVEHVPGNWEPDNQLPPDVFLWTKSKFEFLKVPFYRDAAVEIPSDRNEPGVLRRKATPVSDDIAQDWVERMVEYFSLIRADLASDLPVSVHFVMDADANWYFLNIRPTTHLDVERSIRLLGDDFKVNRFFLIVHPGDVDHWDSQSRILLNSAADKENDTRMAAVAASLRNAGIQEVFCTFGVLSHPAILLREFGLKVSPLYVDHEPRMLHMPRW
ncbi:MAG TPA: PEP/pyruvate-binding domain-containing protein [Streptosporangiaceae bacterium]